MCPLCFLVGMVGFTLAPPSARTTSGARVPSPGHAGGLFRTTEKQKNMRAERASRRVMRGALGFSRGQRGGKAEKHGFRNAEPARRARSPWFSRGQRGEMKLARGGLVPPLFFGRNGRVYTCAPECTNHFGGKGSESGTRRGLVPDDGKAEKHARRKSEPASDARGAWFFARATRRRETNKMRGSCAPSLRG